MAQATYSGTTAAKEVPSRRQLLKLAPAAGMAALLAGAVPVIAQAETPVMAVFREWAALHQRLCAAETTEQEGDGICGLMSEVEGRLKALPSQQPADFVAKIVVMSNYGDFALPDDRENPLLWDEARRALGVAA